MSWKERKKETRKQNKKKKRNDVRTDAGALEDIRKVRKGRGKCRLEAIGHMTLVESTCQPNHSSE